MKTKEIAVFGGSFDPPTVVHQQIVRTLLNDPSFDEVWVMPSGDREDKPHTTAIAKRLAMLATMYHEFGDDDRLTISQFELQLPQPTETYNTVRALEKMYPNTRFWFVFGADSIGTMHTWREGDWLLRKLPMIVVPRYGYTVPATAKHIQGLPDLDIFEQGISSTVVRERVKSGLPVNGLVSKAIEESICDQHLYQPTAVSIS